MFQTSNRLLEKDKTKMFETRSMIQKTGEPWPTIIFKRNQRCTWFFVLEDNQTIETRMVDTINVLTKAANNR